MVAKSMGSKNKMVEDALLATTTHTQESRAQPRSKACRNGAIAFENGVPLLGDSEIDVALRASWTDGCEVAKFAKTKVVTLLAC